MKKLEQERVSPEGTRDRVSPARPGAQKQQSSSHNPVFDLQRTVGNQAVGDLLASGEIHAKLRVSQPGDADEQEADRVAEQIGSPAATLHRKCSCPDGTASCPACEEEKVEKAKGI